MTLDLQREAMALGWYLDHSSVHSGAAACSVCSPANGGLLRELLQRTDARRKPMVQAQPLALEARYRGQLLRRMREIHGLLLAEMRKEVKPRRPEINKRARADAVHLVLLAGTHSEADRFLAASLAALRYDSRASDTAALLRVIARVERAVRRASPVDRAGLGSLADQVRRFTSRSVTRQLLTVAGIDPASTVAGGAGVMRDWATANVNLITSLDQRYFDDIRQAVLATVGEGRSTRALTEAISERYGVTRSRAKLIATDQVGTLNAQITQERQTALGIEEYIWSSSDDNRVRPLHVELDDTVRRWDEPHPTEGHPGMAIRCRCSAIPVIPT